LEARARFSTGLAIIHFEVLDVDNFRRRFRRQLLQCALAFDQRRSAQIVAVEIKQVESGIYQAIGVLLCEFPAQRLEVRQAGIAVHRRFAVHDQLVCRERFGRVCDLAELIGPIVAAARVDCDPLMMDMELCAVAVDLDFVQPSGNIGRAIAQGGIARRMNPGKGARFAPGIAAR
jgi:hypothetical protein